MASVNPGGRKEASVFREMRGVGSNWGALSPLHTMPLPRCHPTPHWGRALPPAAATRCLGQGSPGT